MQLKPRLRSWITDIALPGRRVVAMTTLTGGHSNHNIKVTMADGGTYVLRRYLRNNSCAVEAALAVRVHDTVPVADVVAADPEGVQAGEPAMLSVFQPGEPVNRVLSRLSAVEARQLGRSAGAVLAAIGTVHFPNPGFFADGALVPGPPDAEPTADMDTYVRRCLENGNARSYLTGVEQSRLQRFAASSSSDLERLRGGRSLVHADFNPKNLLATWVAGQWQVTTVLDWEFAFSSSPLFDVGNMLRDDRPDGFSDGFIEGFVAHGGELPAEWRRLSRALDLYSLADLLTRPVEHRYFHVAITRIRALVSTV